MKILFPIILVIATFPTTGIKGDNLSDKTVTQGFAIEPIADVLGNAIASQISEFNNKQYAQEVIEQFHQLKTANKVLATDESKLSHIEMLCGVLAGYQCGLPYFDNREKLLDLMQQTFITLFTPNLDHYINQRFNVDLAKPDLIFERVSENFIARGQEGFGSGFTYELGKNDERHHHVNVVDCFFNNFFRHNNAPEVTRILCAMDMVWADRITGGESNTAFERPTVMSQGGDKCRFHFQRK